MEVLGSIYTEVSDSFQKGIIGVGISRCVKAEKHDLGVVLMEQRRLGNLYGDDRGTGFAGNVWDKNYISPSLTTMQGGMREPMIVDKQIVAMRGRNPENPSDRTAGSQTRRGRVQDNGNTCPTITAQNQEIVRIEKVGQISNDGSQCGTVYSDSGISPTLISGTHGDANSKVFTQYRIRKLTPRECGRLMGVSDEDISNMAAVNSNTQLYKQFGNSIVVDVMCAMFRNLNIEQEVK